MKIICIGRNYADPATPAGPGGEPLFFLRPDTALLRNNDPFYLPEFSREVWCGCELVVRIGRVGRCIEERFARRYYDEVGLGVGFAAHDVLERAMAAGAPWERAVAFDRSAALSPEFVPLDELGGDAQRLRFELEANGRLRQAGDTSRMCCTVDRIIASVSRYVTLRIGDLIYTGTPAGAGAVQAGDSLRATLAGRTLLDFDVR